MLRLACVAAPGFPHHGAQRGNRRQPSFFSERDYEAYLDLMGEWCRRLGLLPDAEPCPLDRRSGIQAGIVQSGNSPLINGISSVARTL